MRAILVTFGLFACAGKPDGAPPTYTVDVAPIVQGRCVGCHADGAIGPFPLDSYDAVAAVGELVKEVTTSRTMPPWGAAAGHRTYQADPSLTDAQVETIARWVDAGMPEGDRDEAGDPLPSLDVALPRVDTTITLPEPYLPAITPDDYRCFVLDWPMTGTQFVTGFEVHPDNDTIVHHVAAFLVRPDGLGDARPTIREWDESEEGPGYTCFGGPSKTGEALDIPVQQVAQWVPGNGGVLFPDGVGIEVPEGSLVVLQMHYNSDSADGNPDWTSVDLMVEPAVERLGAFAPWLDAAWTFDALVIPPNSTGVTYSAVDDPRGFFALLMGDAVDLSQGFDIHGVMLHMHELGRSGIVEHLPQEGADAVLLEVPRWDFDWQFTYAFAEPVPFAPGDEISLSCTFDNPTSEAVLWGEGTGDEMCVANLFVSAPNR